MAMCQGRAVSAWVLPSLEAASVASCGRVDPVGEVDVALDRARQHVEVNDAAARVLDEIDDDCDSRSVSISRDDERARHDDRRVRRLIEEATRSLWATLG